MPLHGNGQSELYVEDILGIDPGYSPERARQVHAAIMVARLRASGRPQADIDQALEEKRAQHALERDLLSLRDSVSASRVLGAIGRLWSALHRALFSAPKQGKDQAALEARLDWIRRADVEEAPSDAEAARIVRQRRIAVLMKQVDDDPLNAPERERQRQQRRLDLDRWLAERRKSSGRHWFSKPNPLVWLDGGVADYLHAVPEVTPADRALLAAFECNVDAAFAALRARDLGAFEKVVDLDVFAFNLAEAMTADFQGAADYLRVPNSLNMGYLASLATLLDARETVMRPVEDGYKSILRHWIAHRELLCEALPAHAAPQYHLEGDGSGERLAVSPLSRYFGPAAYLRLLGRDWKILEGTRRAQAGETDIEVRVANPKTGFVGWLLVRATPIRPTGRVALAFPNFIELHREARKLHEASTGERVETAK